MELKSDSIHGRWRCRFDKVRLRLLRSSLVRLTTTCLTRLQRQRFAYRKHLGRLDFMGYRGHMEIYIAYSQKTIYSLRKHRLDSYQQRLEI